MKTLITIILLTTSLNLNSQNTVCFTIEPNTTNGLAYSEFTKYVNVLNCFNVYAEQSISDEKVLHAAAVAAELLDNNEDGVVDDQTLKLELSSNGALIPIFFQEGNTAENNFFNFYNGNGAAAVLYNNEMDPSQTGHWGSDATVEEVMHVINGIGHVNIYPTAFSLNPNSSLLTAAMDVARGGQFLSVPNPYPASAWYHYDDQTCDYGCMAIEYLYWAQVTNMNILNDPQTAAGIANEWEPYSPALLQSMDTLIYNLITDTQYKLPLLAPDGNYCPTNKLNELKKSFKIYPNPVVDFLIINSKTAGIVNIYDLLGNIIIANVNISNSNSIISLSNISKGSYYIEINNQRHLFVKK